MDRFNYFSADPTIFCTQCRSVRPRAGSIKIPVGRIHERAMCGTCNTTAIEAIQRDKNREAINEQRAEIAASRSRVYAQPA